MSTLTSVLYVDDEETLRVLVPNQLRDEGFTVETADDGDTAIGMIGKKQYDVMLLDIRMPRMNGIEVLKYLRANKINLRVVVLTAFDDLSVALECVKNGANDYVTKPYDLKTLVKCIHKVVAK
jgi:two-component system alkaline phosphatase synthesis response regulator PhoP